MRLQSTCVVLLMVSGLLDQVHSQSIHSSGNCTFLYNTPMQFVCRDIVPRDMYLMFHDNRAPAGTNFSVWEGHDSESGETIVMVSFYTNQFSPYRKIWLQGSDQWAGFYFLINKKNTTDAIWLTRSTIHCFPFSMRYPMELKRFCLGRAFSTDGEDVAKKPVLHYGDIRYKQTEPMSNGAVAFSLPAAYAMIFFSFVQEILFQFWN
ncbi:uncharacterized protein LOC108088810 [Drosophila ficusphila]|uniref:uncharacterized protein LOC108088810 n=1 Tax=Drosophila ficusphila TaxID=30025 RepID=UPI0007E8718F|nr:uncharacterized protein LOC108088810 [Drosophila ficusphila]